MVLSRIAEKSAELVAAALRVTRKQAAHCESICMFRTGICRISTEHLCRAGGQPDAPKHDTVVRAAANAKLELNLHIGPRIVRPGASRTMQLGNIKGVTYA